MLMAQAGVVVLHFYVPQGTQSRRQTPCIFDAT